MSVFDQLRKITATPGAPSAPASAPGAQAAQETIPFTARLERSASEASKKIAGLYQELGKAYYEAHAEDRQTEYEERLAAIRGVHGEIAQYEAQAAEIAAKRRCPSCGKQLAEGSAFCNFCGTKLPDAAPEAPAAGEQGQRLCPKCSAALGPDDMFCTSCGADTRESEA